MTKGWFSRLPSDVYERLCNCASTKEDLPILVNTRWAWMKDKIAEGIIPMNFTKVDALIYILELLDANSQSSLADITVDEYEELIR